MDIKRVKTSNNVRLDEVMIDIEIPSTNARQLRIALDRPFREDHKYSPIIMPPTLYSQKEPFTMIYNAPAKMLCDHDTL